MDELLFPDLVDNAGFRLDRVELLGWGTFDRCVWRFGLDGHTSLLTGDIGSGKSTLVDAITTLMLPANRIAYNKAAGAETRERSLRSYVMGYYKSERSETTGVSRPVGLRDHRSHSAILAVFRDEVLDRAVSLAQVFWVPDDHAGQPNRLYLVAEGDLSIAQDLSGFGHDISTLKRRLRAAGITPHGAFPDYERAFRRALGIPSGQAMDLFHQTVSMKSVGNLNDFVRAHMLEPFDAAADVRTLIEHFEDLTAAHEAVTKARAQLAALDPIVAGCDEADRVAGALAESQAHQQALRFAAARLTHDLVSGDVTALSAGHADAVAALEATRRRIGELGAQRQGLRDAKSGHAGGRVGALEEARERHTKDRDVRARRHAALNEALTAAGLDPLSDPERFHTVRAELASAKTAVHEASESARAESTELQLGLRDARQQAGEISAELRSLGSRRSSIPMAALGLRERLCADLGIDEAGLPFVGELIQVRPEEERWRGAAERVLRGFGLSLIVDDEHYQRVARWVDGRHLGGRLVYHRVSVGARVPAQQAPAGTLASKLRLQQSPYAGWLVAELAARAAHDCVESSADLQRSRRAVTLHGQVKSGSRHEKDDRRAIDDRSAYVLGWDNTSKKDALIERGRQVQESLNRRTESLNHIDERVAVLRARSEALTRALVIDDVRDVDWWESARLAEAARCELLLLHEASAELARIEGRLAEIDQEIGQVEFDRSAQEQLLGRLSDRLEQARAGLERSAQVLHEMPAELGATVEQAVLTLRAEPIGTAADVPAAVEGARAALTELDVQRSQRLRSTQSRVERLMAAFRSEYPAETSDMDASVESAGEFREFRDRVARDDLPRFEADFKRYLNHNTIREIAAFQAKLGQQAAEITARIATINRSLHAIDYNPDRFIRLDALATPFVEVKAFRADLRECTEGALLADSSDELYSEQKFEQVRAIVSRFRGREGFADHDRAWTSRVTDVRNWFVFNASERWRETDQEHEMYADSDGKSGGQKEKLAYTILAASLAYQFGLDEPRRDRKSFRFAVIDEAFGRGSDESTRFALRLFAKLGLQLLVVTPLQKVHTIEPFVQRVGFVDNPSGASSRLHTLTITEYQQERTRVLAAADRAAGVVRGTRHTGETDA